MFKLNENYEIDRRSLKCGRNQHLQKSTLKTPSSQTYIHTPRDDSVISLLKSYLDSNSEVIKKVDTFRYAYCTDIQLVNLGPIVLFSNFKLTTSSGKHLEDISHAHIVSSKYKLISSAKFTEDLSIAFDRSRNRRDELTSIKNIKVTHHIRLMLKDVLGFAEHQENATYGLGFKLTLTTNKVDAVIEKAAGFAGARNKFDHIHWHVPHYIPFLHSTRYFI